jgi:hypothetical protein
MELLDYFHTKGLLLNKHNICKVEKHHQPKYLVVYTMRMLDATYADSRKAFLRIVRGRSAPPAIQTGAPKFRSGFKKILKFSENSKLSSFPLHTSYCYAYGRGLPCKRASECFSSCCSKRTVDGCLESSVKFFNRISSSIEQVDEFSRRIGIPMFRPRFILDAWDCNVF